MNKVLFITYYWPPSGKASLHWPLKIMKHLPKYGWQPSVLTVEEDTFSQQDETLLEDISPELKVIRTKSYEPFNIYKFRTMSPTRENSEFSQAIKNDPRITRVGKTLRRTSLDELPQLVNVLLGTMSLVGPRPHPRKLNEDHRNQIALYMQRHTVKPGITGLAQIRGFRGETTEPQDMEKRIQCDLEYIRTWSISLDFKILLLTVKHIFTTDMAY